MSLELTVNTKIKEAMLGKREAELRTLRAIKAALLVEKTSGTFQGEMTAEAELKILQKLAKQRKDSLEIFEKQDREDLAVKEREELAVIETFLPAQMSEDELRPIIAEIITKVGATGPQDMGKVMGMATKQLAGKADGKTISAIVKSILTA